MVFQGHPFKDGYFTQSLPEILKVLYFANYIVLEEGDTTLTKFEILNEAEYTENRELYGQRFRAEIGAEAIKSFLWRWISMSSQKSLGDH